MELPITFLLKIRQKNLIMKKVIYLLFCLPLLIFTGCDNHDNDCDIDNSTNKVLMLKVDYTTFNLEGVKEFRFDHQTDSFTIVKDYVSPGDFGYIRLIYKELNQQLFYGTIWWDGLGELIYPESFESPEAFESVHSDDAIFPVNGFNCPYQNSFADLDYFNIWLNVQHLEIVRQYLHTNPNQKVQIFAYTPSVGGGDPLEWDYFILMKN